MDGRVALVAHDGRKHEMLLLEASGEWLRDETVRATETTGRLIAERFGLDVECVSSGPMGGDLEIGARVAMGDVRLVVFLRDPLAAHPHEPDIQALMKVCDVHRVPLATNVSTAQLCLRALAAERRTTVTVA